jgi:dihydroxyacid dehydratase/phosphogluconate dehydratase
VLYGNLAPGGAVVKQAAVSPAMMQFSVKPRCITARKRLCKTYSRARSRAAKSLSSVTRARQEARGCAKCLLLRRR